MLTQMMELVELTPLRRLLVGSPAETGLSVEQRKRLSIAVELISNPAIVLMDEPTSGLYSLTHMRNPLCVTLIDLSCCKDCTVPLRSPRALCGKYNCEATATLKSACCRYVDPAHAVNVMPLQGAVIG